MTEDKIVLSCCGKLFSIHRLRPSKIGGYIVSTALNSKVKFCPFCGQELTNKNIFKLVLDKK